MADISALRKNPSLAGGGLDGVGGGVISSPLDSSESTSGGANMKNQPWRLRLKYQAEDDGCLGRQVAISQIDISYEEMSYTLTRR